MMNIDFQNIFLITRKEILDARRNRWFILYMIIFAGLSLGLSWLGLSGIGNYGLSGFGRTSASLINLVLLIVPLMGLTLGASSLAGERERGTLIYILAQPVTRMEVLSGKFLGLGLSLLTALLLGFGLSGILIAWHGGTINSLNYLALVGLTLFLALSSLGIGMLISSALKKADTAIGVSLFVWLVLVFFGDLGIMGSALTLNFDIKQLFILSLFNPLQVFKLSAIFVIQGNLEIFGPVGVYAARTYGDQFILFLIGIMTMWIIFSFTGSYFIFKKKGAL
jgi:Cu-processing system permease protein